MDRRPIRSELETIGLNAVHRDGNRAEKRERTDHTVHPGDRGGNGRRSWETHLNDIERADDWPPGAENLVLWIFQMWRERYPELSGVAISETPKMWATYRPGTQCSRSAVG